jgi:hypothetical protein
MTSKEKIFFTSLSVICLTLALVNFVPSWRNHIRELFISETPVVLSTIEKDFFEDGRIIVFAKIKSTQGLFVEVYEKVTEGFPKTITKIKLPDSIDGFFHFRGQATNLALDDIDGDGVAEILAPSFDPNHIAHLNVYTYNKATEQFEALPPSALDN